MRSLSLRLSLLGGLLPPLSCARVPSGLDDLGPPVVYTDLTVASDHACGTTTTGATYCWGGAGSNQLGTLSIVDQCSYNEDYGAGGLATYSPYCALAPVLVAGGHSFQQVIASRTVSGDDFDWQGAFTCGLTAAGAAYCWGVNNAGEIGIGTDSVWNPSMFSTMPDDCCVATPSQVESSSPFTTLAAGRYHACGLTSAGALYCWGDNSQGQLGTGILATAATGDNASIDNDLPTAVDAGIPFVAVTAAAYTTCALDGDGGVWCWGGDVASIPDYGLSPTPALMPGLPGGGAPSSIDSAQGHVCALTSGGSAYCLDLTPAKIDAGWLPVNPSGPPFIQVVGMGVQGGQNADDTWNPGAGCGLTADGGALCWGTVGTLAEDGVYGQYSIGAGFNPTPTPIVAGVPFTKIAAGGAVACGLGQDGSIWCWGRGETVFPLALTTYRDFVEDAGEIVELSAQATRVPNPYRVQ